jgi:hypothetical protein
MLLRPCAIALLGGGVQPAARMPSFAHSPPEMKDAWAASDVGHIKGEIPCMRRPEPPL